jgi:hypothetical protein
VTSVRTAEHVAEGRSADGGGFVERIGLDVGHHHRAPSRRHAIGQREADATGGTGHHRGLSLEGQSIIGFGIAAMYILRAVADEPERSIERPKTSTRDRAALRAGLESWLRRMHPAGTSVTIVEFDAPSANGMSSETILVTVEWEGTERERLVRAFEPRRGRSAGLPHVTTSKSSSESCSWSVNAARCRCPPCGGTSRAASGWVRPSW